MTPEAARVPSAKAPPCWLMVLGSGDPLADGDDLSGGFDNIDDTNIADAQVVGG